MNNTRTGFLADSHLIRDMLGKLSLSGKKSRDELAAYLTEDAPFVSMLGSAFTDALRELDDASSQQFLSDLKNDCVLFESILNNLDLRESPLLNKTPGDPLFRSPLSGTMEECIRKCLTDLSPYIEDLCLMQEMLYRYDFASNKDLEPLYYELKGLKEYKPATWIGQMFFDGLLRRTSGYIRERKRKKAYLVTAGVAAAVSLVMFAAAYPELLNERQHIAKDEALQEIMESTTLHTVNRYTGFADAVTDSADISFDADTFTVPVTPAVPEVLPQYRNLYKLNEDLRGWLKFEALGIDLPVMQSKADGYYLTHDFFRNEDNYGSLFISPEASVYPRSDNIVIYGHNMKNGDMFGNMNLLTSKASVEMHPTFRFDTVYEEGVYEIISVLKTQVLFADEHGFRYYHFYDYSTRDELDTFVRFLKENELFDLGKDIRVGDSFVILSTCEYSKDHGRLLVVGRKIR